VVQKSAGPSTSRVGAVSLSLGGRARPRRLGALALAAATVVGTLASGAAAMAANRTSATHSVPLALRGLNRTTYLGPARAGAVRTIGLFLNRPDPAGEQAYYDAVYDPSSPLFHRFLTPAQFAARFGVPAAQTKAVESWLAHAGVKVDGVAGDYVTAHGTVAALDRLFVVHIGRYQVGRVAFVANDRAPRVPVDLPVASVVGLDTLHRFTTAGLTVPPLPSLTPTPTPTSAPAPARAASVPAAASPATSPATHSAPAPASTGPAAAVARVAPAASTAGSFAGTLTPSDLWGVYDLPAGDLGQGQTAGMFGEGDPSPVINNLRLFEQHFGFPKVPVRTVFTEKGPRSAYSDNAGNIEWYIDTQAITGMAPNLARLDMYFAKSLYDADVYADFASWVNDLKGPAQMNASFGECETDPLNALLGPLAQQPYGTEMGNDLEVQLGGEAILRQAAIEGRTLFTSAGDTGSGCPQVVVPVGGAGNGVAIQPVPMVNYPAASDYAVGVGGTVVTVGDPNRTQRQSEVSWTFTGGGPSHFIAEPSFQKGVKAVDQPCLSQPNGSPYPSGTICRGVPDVASLSGNVANLSPDAVNNPSNGYSIYIDGNLSAQGGTSLSSPLWVGMWSRIQAAAAAAHQGNLGFADPVLYAAAAHHPGTFYDVTAAETPAGNGAYQPAPGWDYTSGLGAPDVAKLIRAILGGLPTLSGSASAGPAKPQCTAVLISPPNNATDPVDVQLGDDPGLDIDQATLSARRTTVTATFTGPAVTALNPPTATAGRDLYLLWSWGPAGKTPTVWYLNAHFDNAGLITVSSGSSTSSGADQPYTYTNNPSTKATYTVKANTLTITAPLSEVGSPPPGAQLAYPFALVQEDVGNPNVATDTWAGLGLVADSAATPRGIDPSLGVSAQVGC